MGCFFVKKWKMGGRFFVKSGSFLNAGCVMYIISIFYFTFYLFGGGCVRTQSTSLSTGLMYSNASILGGQTELN